MQRPAQRSDANIIFRVFQCNFHCAVSTHRMAHDTPFIPGMKSIVFTPNLSHQILNDIILIISIERRIGIETSFVWFAGSVGNDKNDLKQLVKKNSFVMKLSRNGSSELTLSVAVTDAP